MLRSYIILIYSVEVVMSYSLEEQLSQLDLEECIKEYKHLRYGDPIRKFQSKINVGELYECWPWLGSTNGSGYGMFGGRMAHRLAWELHHKEYIPEGYLVCHHC